MSAKDKIRELLRRFPAATIKAAIAENPSIMTASGWRIDNSGVPVQDAVEDEGVNSLRDSLAEIAMIPIGDVAAEFLFAIPAIRTGLKSLRTIYRRNSPAGKSLTNKVKDALSHIDDIVSESGRANVNSELKDFLVNEGVDPNILTDEALEKLTRARQIAIEKSASSAPGRFVMRTAPEEGGYQFYTAFEPGYPKVRESWPENAIGYVGIEPLQDGNVGIQMIENVTRRAYPNPEAHGVSESLMNAVIKDKGHVVSGRQLMSPEVTTHIWEKYPQKELVGNYGRWKEAARTYSDGHPVYKITRPTYDIQLKFGDVFSANGIDDAGNFLVDFSKGPEFASGGNIYIKPSHRGRLTELKERTGKTEAELYNDGNPAHKKMVVFARNARKWHADGGQLKNDKLRALADRVSSTSSADFVHRLLDPNRAVLYNEDGTVSTHELGYVTEGNHAVVFPSVQSVGDSLARFTYPESYERAVENGDTVHMSIPEARLFTRKYKSAFPGFEQYVDGGRIRLRPSTDKTTSAAASTGNDAVDKVVVDYSGIKTTNNRKYNKDYISYISDSLKSSGISDIKRAAILGNIIEESGGDPFALDDAGKFYGLLQWADDRYQKTSEKDVYKEIDNQLDYILKTLGNTTDRVSWTHGGKGTGYNSYADAMKDFDSDDLATAMRGFTLGYVRPTGKVASYNNRLKVANQVYGLKGFKTFDAGGFIEKYGADKILAALERIKQSK